MPERRSRKAGMIFIVITMFLDVLGIGIIIPVLPALVTELSGGDPSEGATYYGLIASSFALMQFVFAPLLGKLSDRFGRRPVLLLALFGFGVNYLLIAAAPTLAWLFVARILSGITGASFTTANAYIADISDETNRAANFGMVGAVFGLGFIFGPALGGVLGGIGARVPFYVSAAVVFVNFFYGLLLLPESLPKERRQAIVWSEANPLGGVLALRRYRMVGGLALAFVFFSLAQRGMESVWVLYTTYRYNWQAMQNGLALTLVGVMAAFVQGYLIRKIVPVLGERRAVLIGLSIGIVGFVLYGLAWAGWTMLLVVVFASLSGIAAPSIQSLVASSVPPQEQGGVQGTLTSLMSLTAIASPLIATQLFAHFTHAQAAIELPGAPFFAGAVFMTAGLVVVVLQFRRLPEVSPSRAPAFTAATESE